MRILFPLALLLGGCWNGQPSTLELDETSFAPAAGALPGWSVRTDIMEGVLCPDGTTDRFYTVYPTDAAGPQPIAVILHAGALDWVVEPDATDPLAGEHYNDPSRLSSEFSIAKTFSTLGMYPDVDAEESNTGALAYAFAEQGVTLVLPGNCWGDMWRNREADQGNDTTTDGFVRKGGDAAKWAWQFVAEPGFPTANRITPAVEFDRDQMFLVGLAEGGRGVSELLADGADPTGVLLDSTADDLTPYYGDTELYGDVLVGLSRIFPDGEASVDAGALHDTATPLPARVAYVYSSLDGLLPATAHDAAIARLEAEDPNSGGAEVWVQDTLLQSHISTARDGATAAAAVDFLLGN